MKMEHTQTAFAYRASTLPVVIVDLIRLYLFYSTFRHLSRCFRMKSDFFRESGGFVCFSGVIGGIL